MPDESTPTFITTPDADTALTFLTPPEKPAYPEDAKGSFAAIWLQLENSLEAARNQPKDEQGLLTNPHDANRLAHIGYLRTLLIDLTSNGNSNTGIIDGRYERELLDPDKRSYATQRRIDDLKALITLDELETRIRDRLKKIESQGTAQSVVDKRALNELLILTQSHMPSKESGPNNPS